MNKKSLTDVRTTWTHFGFARHNCSRSQFFNQAQNMNEKEKLSNDFHYIWKRLTNDVWRWEKGSGAPEKNNTCKSIPHLLTPRLYLDKIRNHVLIGPIKIYGSSLTRFSQIGRVEGLNYQYISQAISDTLSVGDVKETLLRWKYKSIGFLSSHIYKSKPPSPPLRCP